MGQRRNYNTAMWIQGFSFITFLKIASSCRWFRQILTRYCLELHIKYQTYLGLLLWPWQKCFLVFYFVVGDRPYTAQAP